MDTLSTQEDDISKEGLIYAYILDGKGGGKPIGWPEVRTWNPKQGTLWMHLNYTNPTAKKWLAEESGLDSISMEAMMLEEVRPRVIEDPSGLIVLLRGVNENPGADPEDMVAVRVWIDHSRIITTRNRRVLSVDDVNDIIGKGNAPKNPSNFLAVLIDFLINRMADVIDHLSESTDDVEEDVMTAEPYAVRPKISNLRREVISLRRFLAPQRDTLAHLYIEESPWVSKQDRLHIREATDRITYYIENLDECRERATVTHEELTSRISEQVDHRMFLLSMIAVIFLPLTFITGLLGINVGGIPGSQNHWAFPIVSVTLIGLAVIQLIFFKRKKWL